jgi:GNAT superfamily N-acetyltransferase
MHFNVRKSSRMTKCLRPATETDLPLLVELMDEFYVESGYQLDVGRGGAALRRLVTEPDLGRLWVVLSDGAAVGYIALCFGFSLEYYGRDAFVDDFFIRPPFRSRGLGDAVLGVVVAECSALGVLALHLEAERTNAAAQVLYRKHGFRDNDRQLLSRRLTP